MNGDIGQAIFFSKWPRFPEDNISKPGLVMFMVDILLPLAAIASAMPKYLNTCMALLAIMIPAPTGFNSGALSYTLNGIFACLNAKAVVKPPMPPPIIATFICNCYRAKFTRAGGINVHLS
nr:hypothetical protein [Paraflavitalea speifideiaquila]